MADEVQILEVTVGTGASPTPTSVVKMTYEGTLADGTAIPGAKVTDPVEIILFDDAPPGQFTQSVVIQGFTQGILGMKEGGTRKITIPPSLAYGTDGLPPIIAPNQTLVFTVTLTKVLDFQPIEVSNETDDRNQF